MVLVLLLLIFRSSVELNVALEFRRKPSENLAKMEWRESTESPDGYEYYCEEIGPETMTGSRSKNVSLNAKKDGVTAADHAASLALTDEDHAKMKQRLGVSTSSASSTPTAIEDKSAGKGKGKGSGKGTGNGSGKGKVRASATNVEHLGLDDDEQELAKAVVEKNAWQKGCQNVKKKCDTYIDDDVKTQGLIKQNEGRVGKKLISVGRLGKPLGGLEKVPGIWEGECPGGVAVVVAAVVVDVVVLVVL